MLATQDNLDVFAPQVRSWSCSLAWCEKTFKPSVSKGSPSLEVVAEVPLYFLDMYAGGSNPDLAVASEEWYVYGRADQLNKTVNIDSSYLVRVEAHSQIFDYLHSLFDISYASTLMFGTGVQPNITRVPASTAIARALAYSSDINATINKVTATLSEVIRIDGNSTEVVGQTWILKTFIRVRWEWLAFPLGLLLLTCSLFVVVAIRSYRTQIPIWKEDPLALLFHNVDDSISKLEDLSPQRLRAMADELEVKLSRSAIYVFEKPTSAQ
jgi:hypothetical protein